jgi:hypothetical protein
MENIPKFTLIYIAYRIMSFLKITDPAKRDLLVQELIKTSRNIMQDTVNEQIEDFIAQQSLRYSNQLLKRLKQQLKRHLYPQLG